MTTDPQPLELRAPTGAMVLEIDWDDGVKSRFDHRLLRGFCPCAHCQGHQGPIKWSGDFEGLAVQIADIEEIGNYAVRLSWADGHSTGLYSFSFLSLLRQISDEPLENVKAARLGR